MSDIQRDIDDEMRLSWGADTADILVERMRRAGGIARSADRDISAEIIRKELRARDAALREARKEIERLRSRTTISDALPDCMMPDGAEPCRGYSVALAEIDRLRDMPDTDASEDAHPAWWRGVDHGCCEAVEVLRKAADGEDDGVGVIGYEPLEALRRRLIAMRAELHGRDSAEREDKE